MLNFNTFMRHSISMGLLRQPARAGDTTLCLHQQNRIGGAVKKVKSQFLVFCVKNVFISISVETPFC